MRPLLPDPGFRSLLVSGSLALLLLCLGAPPVAADWIVLRDGKMLQTDGPWAVKGDRLLFTSTEGHRRALPLAEVDLESSHHASGTTASGKARSSPGPDSATRPATHALGETEGPPPTPASGLPTVDPRAVTNVGDALMVTERRDELGGGALHLTGKLHNRGRDQARNVSLIATLHDDEGEILEFKKAQLSSRTLGPDQKTNFRATFPGITAYSNVTFEGTVPPPEPEVTEEMVAEAIARAKADAQRRETERLAREKQDQLRAEAARRKRQEAARRAESDAARHSAKTEPASTPVVQQRPVETPVPRSTASPSSSPGATRLVGVRTDRLQTGTVVTVEANKTLDEASISQFRLENPPRLVLRISDVSEPYDVASVSSPEIVQARAGLHSTAERGDEIHLVFELASPDVESSVSTRGGQVLVKLEQR